MINDKKKLVKTYEDAMIVNMPFRKKLDFCQPWLQVTGVKNGWKASLRLLQYLEAWHKNLQVYTGQILTV